MAFIGKTLRQRIADDKRRGEENPNSKFQVPVTIQIEQKATEQTKRKRQINAVQKWLTRDEWAQFGPRTKQRIELSKFKRADHSLSSERSRRRCFLGFLRLLLFDLRNCFSRTLDNASRRAQ
ncbi:MAG TPA: hypothetical protein VIV82_06430 [Verrucomicrobiae bacterium]